MKKLLIASTVGLALCGSANADTIFGLYAGAYNWKQDYDGFVEDLNANQANNPLVFTDLDLSEDLGLKDDNGTVFYAAIEHPIPVLPNFRLQYTDVEIDGQNSLDRQIEFNGETFLASADVVSDADFSHTDATFYYEILDNWISLDLGLTVRFFDGYVHVEESGGNSAEEEFKAPVPLLYAATKFELPLTGVYVGGNVQGLGVGDNSFIDYQLTLGYESKWGLGVEAGYRSMKLELDDLDDVRADLTIDGAYIGLMFHL